MALEYRNPTEDELRATFDAANVAFGNELRDDDFEIQKRELPADRVIAAFDDGHPVGLTASIAFEMTIPGGVEPCAGITYVGVMPTHRRRGVLTQLMRKQLDDLHERGEPLAALWASESVIYGRFGYGIARAVRLRWRPRRQASRFATTRGRPARSACSRRRRRDGSSRRSSSVRGCSAKGMLSRSEARWDARVEDPEHWRDGARPKYYVLIEIDGQRRGVRHVPLQGEVGAGHAAGELVLVDAIATSTEATRELWRYLFGVDLIARVTLWNFDPATPLFLMVKDARRLQLKLVRRDLATARGRRRGAAATLVRGRQARVVLEVTDEFCPWNDGRYRAGAKAGRARAEAELRLSAADLASTYLGAFSFERLAAAGRVEELADGAIARASALFRTELPPHCLEPF